MASNRVSRYLGALDEDGSSKLAQMIYRRFREMVAAQVDVADGADRGDDRARAATLAMVALATATAGRAIRAKGARTLPAYDYDEAARRLALPAMSKSRGRRRVSTDDGRSWVDYDSLIDPDPFESYPLHHTIED